MQIYKGLDIASAKLTKDEMQGIPHHMLDVALPTRQMNVVSFCDMALPVVDGILKRKRLPILVGGTNYWIQAMLWPSSLVSTFLKSDAINININNSEAKKKNNVNNGNDNDKSDSESDISDNGEPLSTSYYATPAQILSQCLKRGIPDVTNDLVDDILVKKTKCLHDVLKIIDPRSADRLSASNERKITRSIEIYLDSGMTQTEIFQKQREAMLNSQNPNSNHDGNSNNGMRYRSVFVWLDCSDSEVLSRRLDDRVDKMVEKGLIMEIDNLRKQIYAANSNSANDDKDDGDDESDESDESDDEKIDKKEETKAGLLQAIGYKELLTYLERKKINNVNNVMDEDEDEKQLKMCVDVLKINTRKYAKRQLQWIKNKILPSPGVECYKFDTSDFPNGWMENIVQPVTEIATKTFEISNIPSSLEENVNNDTINNNNSNQKIFPLLQILFPNHPNLIQIPKAKFLVRKSVDVENWRRHCDICNKTVIGCEEEWQSHLKSKKHYYASRPKVQWPKRIKKDQDDTSVVNNNNNNSNSNNSNNNNKDDFQ